MEIKNSLSPKHFTQDLVMITIQTNNNMELNDQKELLSILKANTNQLHASIETGLPQGNISRALNSSCSLATFVKICNASNIKIELKKVETLSD